MKLSTSSFGTNAYRLGATGLACGDINDDGYTDIVVNSSGSYDYWHYTFFGDAAGAYSVGNRAEFYWYHSAYEIEVYPRDGMSDLIIIGGN